MLRKTLKIGDVIYKRVTLAGIMSYTVYEVRETKDSILYAIRCNDCRGHKSCELFLADS